MVNLVTAENICIWVEERFLSFSLSRPSPFVFATLRAQMDEIEHTLDTIYCISRRVSIYKNKVYDHNKCLYCENTTNNDVSETLWSFYT